MVEDITRKTCLLNLWLWKNSKLAIFGRYLTAKPNYVKIYGKRCFGKDYKGKRLYVCNYKERRQKIYVFFFASGDVTTSPGTHN